MDAARDAYSKINVDSPWHGDLRYMLVCAISLLCLFGCRRAEGPLGIHVGDTVSINGDSGAVRAMGIDWIDLGGMQFGAANLTRAYVDCPHD